MRLIDILDQVMMERDLAPCTEAQYAKSIVQYSSFLERDATILDFDYKSLNRWLRSMRPQLEPRTIRNKTKGISVVWNHYAREHNTDPYHPVKVYKPKLTPKPVKSWTLNEFRLLLAGVDSVKGFACGMAARDMLNAWLWVGYDTAFRPSDMRLLEWTSVSFERKSIVITQHKTKRVHTANLSEQSLEALNAIRSPSRTMVFPVTKDGMRYWLAKLYKQAAAVGFYKQKGQSIGTLRKLHATMQYEDFGLATAAESLGHVGGTRTVLNHYIDARSIRGGKIPRRP